MTVDDRPAASSAEYWDDEWRALDPPAELERLRHSPSVLLRALDAAMPNGVVLEAGSGPGVIAAFLARPGRRVVALDFAIESLRRAPAGSGILPVAGDLRTLPFRDASFDGLVSLGAVEHAAAGPLAALREHRRIVQRGGTLFLTVPTLNLVKRWNDTRLRFAHQPAYVSVKQRRIERVPSYGVPMLDDHHVFVQYEIPRRDIKEMLRQAGFEPERVWLTQTSAGLGEVGIVQHLHRRRSSTSASPGSAEASGGGAAPTSSAASAWRRAALGEDASGPWRLLRLLARETIGHSVAVIAKAV